MAYWPDYSLGMVTPPMLDHEDDLSEEERQEAHDRLEQQTFLPRFGLPKPPPIVTSATVIPNTPRIPRCHNQRPRLNILQLIALAIIGHVNRSPTGQELLQWIEDRFEYFMWHPVGLAQIRTRLQDFFFEYDPPIVPLSDKYHHFAMPWEVYHHLNLRYAVVVGHLNILFPADSSTSFRFMALPAELRLQVYEYALEFPCKQLTKMSRGSKSQGHINSRVRYDEDLPSGWSGTTFFTGPKGITALALLSVSKKVREEAFPIFYRNNAFSLSTGGDISHILTKMGATRRSFIRNLTIEYCAWSSGHWIRVLEMLADFEELDNLTLCFISSGALQYDEHGPAGYRALSTIRGIKKLTIHGRALQSDIDKIRAYLEPLLTQPRVKSEEVAIEGPARKRLKMDTT